MLSLQSTIELISVVEGYVERIVDRIFTVFDLEHLIRPIHGKFNKDQKLNILLKTLKYETKPGPFTSSIRMDLLQHMINHYYRGIDDPSEKQPYNEMAMPYEDKFSFKHPALANSLKRDGYIIKGRTIKKLLPEEIEEAKTESELFILLDKFKFNIAKGHLEQGISNHSQGNWAGANSQFRPFVESLLMNICNLLLPSHPCTSAAEAINLLSKVANPPFLREDLNEVESQKCKKPFIEGLWKRLHPHGNHPGLSDEEDSTFRYHISIVLAHYLLKRLGNTPY